MSAVSEVSICNRALQKIGESQIMSLDDKIRPAVECKRLYAYLRDTLNGSYAWNFAKKRALLPEMADAPIGFDRQFQLPSDCLRVHGITTSFYWSNEGGRILTNASAPLEIHYASRVTDTNKFDPLFTEALASYMASELAEVFTQSDQKRRSLWEEYQAILQKAVSVDARQQPPRPLPEPTWITSRY